MENLAELAAAVTQFAAGAALTLVPAVPQHDCGPEVCLGPDAVDLTGFLAIARKIGGGVLYLQAVPFDPGADEDAQVDDAVAHLLSRKGETGEITVAFAANGIVHFWEHSAAWYLEWQGLTDPEDEAEGQDDRLSGDERARVAGELADVILADARFRTAQPGHRPRIAQLAIPPGTDQWAGYDGARLACDRAEEMAQQQYGPDGRIRARLGELAAEFLASEEYRAVSSAAARKEATVTFLASRADGFRPPPVIRDELYARAQELAKAAKGNTGLF
jgi:hypothetical protein